MPLRRRDHRRTSTLAPCAATPSHPEHGEHHTGPLIPLRRLFPPLARPRCPSAARQLLRRRAAPLLAVASPVQTRPCPAFASGGSLMPRRRFPQQNPTQTEAGIARPCHAGEPGPPLAVASPAGAQNRHPACSNVLRVSRSSFCTRPQPKRPTGAPEQPSPASSRRLRSPPAKARSIAPPSVPQCAPSRPILRGRIGLERAYRFAGLFVKEPSVFC